MENAALDELFSRHDAPACTLLVPENFQGPSSLLVGPAGDEHRRLAGALILRHARRFDPTEASVRVRARGKNGIIRVAPDARAASLERP